jgi:hypothetical protein
MRLQLMMEQRTLQNRSSLICVALLVEPEVRQYNLSGLATPANAESREKKRKHGEL